MSWLVTWPYANIWAGCTHILICWLQTDLISAECKPHKIQPLWNTQTNVKKQLKYQQLNWLLFSLSNDCVRSTSIVNWITWCWKLTIALELEILCNGMNIVFFSIFVLGFVDSANRLDCLFNYSRIQTSGRKIGWTFNGQYQHWSCSWSYLLTYSVDIQLIRVSWEARQACIPLIMKVIEFHRTTPTITRLNGRCRMYWKKKEVFLKWDCRVSAAKPCHPSLPKTLAIIFLDNLRGESAKSDSFLPYIWSTGLETWQFFKNIFGA